VKNRNTNSLFGRKLCLCVKLVYMKEYTSVIYGSSRLFKVEDILQIGKRLSDIDPSKQPNATVLVSSVVKDLMWIRDRIGENNIDGDTASGIYDYTREIEVKHATTPTPKTLDSSDRQILSTKIGLWFGLIEKSLKQRKIVEPAKIGILNQEQLYNASSKNTNAFFDNVWWNMSEIEREDFGEAARCLLAQSWTAAAMITLRGLESILRKYYTFKTKREIEKKGIYVLIDELQQTQGISQILMGYLNYLRGIRNTAEHPDRTFNQIGAETVFTQVAGAAREIYAEMK
jgi:hypothetical protein